MLFTANWPEGGRLPREEELDELLLDDELLDDGLLDDELLAELEPSVLDEDELPGGVSDELDELDELASELVEDVTELLLDESELEESPPAEELELLVLDEELEPSSGTAGASTRSGPTSPSGWHVAAQGALPGYGG